MFHEDRTGVGRSCNRECRCYSGFHRLQEHLTATQPVTTAKVIAKEAIPPPAQGFRGTTSFRNPVASARRKPAAASRLPARTAPREALAVRADRVRSRDAVSTASVRDPPSASPCFRRSARYPKGSASPDRVRVERKNWRGEGNRRLPVCLDQRYRCGNRARCGKSRGKRNSNALVLSFIRTEEPCATEKRTPSVDPDWRLRNSGRGRP